MSATVLVRLTPRGGLLFAPAGYLGPERYEAFRAAVRGLRRVDKPAPGHGTRDAETAAAAVAALQGAGFEVRAESDALARLREGADALRRRTEDRERGLDDARERLASLGRAARGPYQEQGIEWLCSRRAALLLDDMGTGKSMMALSAAGGLALRPRVLVVAPASVVGGWLVEARAWLGDVQATRIAAGADFRWPAEGEVVALSYDALARADALGLLRNAPAGVVFIPDEVHLCKNAKVQRTKAARAARRAVLANGGWAWGLTGTPIQNAPAELWTVLGVLGLGEEAFGSYPRYCTAWGGPEAVRSPDAAATPAVAEGLARVAIRRTKDEVLPDLPPKRVEVRHAPLEGRAAELAEDLRRRVEGLAPGACEADIARALEAASELGEVAAARAVIALAKLPVALEEVEACEAAGEPLVVATAHRSVAETIGGRPGWGLIAGGVPPEERTRIVADFQAGKLCGVALTIRAGGTGLTLTRAARILFVDQDWNPAQNAQCEDRIHRIGQTRPCTVVVLVGDCWIERRVEALCGSKSALAADALAPLAGRDRAPVAVPDLDAVRVIEPPRVAQQAAPGATDARPAGDGWIPVDDALREHLERLAVVGSTLARVLLDKYPDRLPPRAAPSGQPKRPMRDLLTEETARFFRVPAHENGA